MDRIVGITERFRGPEKSKNVYALPFPPDAPLTGIEREGPAHQNEFKGALDFLVPLGTSVLSPLDGEVTVVVDSHDRFGPSEKYVNDLNYITIKHAGEERSQLAHLGKGTARVKPGDTVTQGQVIAETGQSGWMTEPHLHFIVFKLIKNVAGFKGLESRFNQRLPRISSDH